MPQRQKIGLRKALPPTTREPGRVRRRALLDASYELLSERDIDDISFRDIAKAAGVPEASAYHFFANRYDIFAALACELNKKFVRAHERSVPPARRESRRDLVEYMVDLGARVYSRTPPARQLFIGARTPYEVKQSERRNDHEVAAAMQRSFERYFPETPDMRSAFGFFIEITDLMFTLSIVEHGRITAPMLREAKRAGSAYLSTYFEAI